MARSKNSKLAILYLTPYLLSAIPALTVGPSAAQMGSLDRRQDSCPTNFQRCADPKLPSNFCCPAGDTCLSLDGSSTALCCPNGNDCKQIRPISCNVGFQDASSKADAAIKTTRLKDKLPTCGQSCCPFGYQCQGDTICVLADIKSSTAASSATSASKTASATASPSSTIPAIAAQQTPLCTRFPGGAVAVGFFPGLFAGAILALIGVILLGKQHEKRPHSKGSMGGSSHKYSNSLKRGRAADGTVIGISDPIPMQDGGARTDFLRRQNTLLRTGTNRAKSWFSPRSMSDAETATSPLNPINHWKMPTPPEPNNIPANPKTFNVPFTPPSQIRGGPGTVSSIAREPSSESIKIYSPPSMVSPPSKSGFSPNDPPSSKQSIFSKLSPKISNRFSPFKGTELRPKHSTTSPPLPTQEALYPNHPAFQNRPQPPSSAPSPIPSPPPAALAPAPLATRSQPNPYTFPDSTNNSQTHLGPLPNTTYQTPDSTYPTYTTPHVPNQPNSNPSAFLTPNPKPLTTRDPSTLHPPESRPLTHMTTFTDVLRDAGLEGRDDRPDVPELPKGLDVGGGGRNGGSVMGGGKWGNVVDKKVRREGSRGSRRRRREERREGSRSRKAGRG